MRNYCSHGECFNEWFCLHIYLFFYETSFKRIWRLTVITKTEINVWTVNFLLNNSLGIQHTNSCTIFISWSTYETVLLYFFKCLLHPQVFSLKGIEIKLTRKGCTKLGLVSIEGATLAHSCVSLKTANQILRIGSDPSLLQF